MAVEEVEVEKLLDASSGGRATTVGKGNEDWRRKTVLRTSVGELSGEVSRVDLGRDMATRMAREEKRTRGKVQWWMNGERKGEGEGVLRRG